jgi:mono/diheme cytochrome c family protein
MKKINWILMPIVSVTMFALAACAAAAPAAPAGEPTDVPVTAPYAGMKNPFDGKADAAAAGKVIYTDNCATCHGDAGKGDGPGGASLKVKPADLAEVAANDPDDRIFWVINVGGETAGYSADMKAWKDQLSQDEIWQTVTYIRSFKK